MPRRTQVPARVSTTISDTGVSPSSPLLPSRFSYCVRIRSSQVLQPRQYVGLGSSPFARRYLGNRFISFFSYRYLDVSVPCVSLPLSYVIQIGIHTYKSMWVPPFGYPRFIACLLLPAASRRLLRPSSPPSA